MSWVKLDDQFPSHPKVLRAGLEARALYVTSLCYCANHLTDGFVTVEVTPLLTAMSQISNGDLAVKKLVDVGLWEVCEGGYTIHDYLIYNPNGDKVKAERKANADRQARYRGYSNAKSNGVTNGATNALPVPVPVLNNKPSASAKQVKESCPKEWMDKLYSLTETDQALASAGMRKRISETGKALIKSGAKLEDVERFSSWWLSDAWRKEHTPIPTPEGIRDNWGKMNGHPAPEQPKPRKVYQ
jgi:hypothetical protein